MSKKYPIISVTGSSGAGTTTVKNAFEHIFTRLSIRPAVIEGDSFHRYNHEEMRGRVDEAEALGRNFSHFGSEANLLAELADLFYQYGETGQGMRRRYVHAGENEEQYDTPAGCFTPWEPLPEDAELLFYEGLHGATVMEKKGIDIAGHADLLIGVVPIVNLEWIQKIHRDTAHRGYETDDVNQTIMRRMYDYVHMITPQFSRTDINFQRVPTVDTSNPFVARDVPTSDESFVVIRFREPEKFQIDFPYLLAMLHDSFMSRRNTIVVPGGKMGLAMEIIFTPIIEQMIKQSRYLKS